MGEERGERGGEREREGEGERESEIFSPPKIKRKGKGHTLEQRTTK